MYLIIFIFMLGGLFVSCRNEAPSVSMTAPTIDIIDSLVMVDFYHSMKGTEWEKKWDLKRPETWVGVTFKTSDKGVKVVSGIDVMPCTSVKESALPLSISKLKHLKELYIINTPIVSFLPDEIYDCDSLQIIWLENNDNMQGPLSPEIIHLNSLRILAIRDCPNFVSELIPEVPLCNSKLYLEISDTGFYGKIPFEIGRLSGARLMYNHFNDIDWRLFTEGRQNIPFMSFNDFTGVIPERVFSSSAWQEEGSNVYPFNEGFGFENYDWENPYW